MVAPTGGGASLGTAHGKITLDASGAISAANQVKGAVRGATEGMKASFQSVGDSVVGLGTSLTTLTAPFSLFAGKGISAASSFSASLKQIEVRTGATAEQMEMVKQTALDLGAATVFSSQQASDAFLQLLTAGMSVEDALETIPVVLDAAAASGEDLGRSADLVTNIMSVFSLEAKEATMVVDNLSAAAASSPATMGEMAEGLQRVGGFANSLGIDMEETSAILAIFAQNGIRGSEAGTALKSVLRNMSAETPKTKAAWEELGISLFDANGEMRNLDTVFSELRIKMDDLPMEDANRLASQLAGSYGITGFNALLASDGIDAMKDKMSGQTKASEVAAARMDTFNGALTSLKGSIETLQITVFTPFMQDILKPLVELLIEATNSVTAWAAEHPELTKRIVAFMSVLSVLGPALIAVGFAIKAIGGLLAPIGSAFSVLTGPIGLTIAALVALKVAYDNNFLGIADTIDGVVEKINRAIDSFKLGLEIGNGVIKSFGIALAGMFPEPVAKKIISLADLVSRGFDRLKATVDVLRLSWSFFKAQIRDGVAPLEALKNTLSAFGGAFGDAIGLDVVQKKLSAAGDKIRNSLITALGPKTSLKLLTASIRIKNQMSSLKDSFTEFWEALEHTPDIGFAFELAFEDALGAERSAAIGEKISAIETQLENFWDGIRLVATGDFVGGTFQGASEDSEIVNFWFGVRDALKGAIDSIEETLGKLPGLGSGIKTFVEDNFGEINFENIARLGQILWGLMSPIGIIFTLLREFAGIGLLDIINGIIDGFQRFFDTLNSGGSLGDAISAAFNLEALGAEGSPLAGVVTAITEFVQPIIDAIDGVINEDIIPGIQDVIDGITGFFDEVGKADTEGLDKFFAAVGNAIGIIVDVVGGLAGGVLEGIGVALPELGAMVADFIGFFSDLGEGDIEGMIERFISFLGNAKDAFFAFAGAIADSVLEIVEDIFNVELPDVAAGMAGWQSAAHDFGIIMENIFIKIRIAFSDIKLEVLKLIATAEAATGGVSATTEAELTAAAQENLSLKGGLAFSQAIRDQLRSEKIDLSEIITIDVGGLKRDLSIEEILFGKEVLSELGGTGGQRLTELIELAATQMDTSSLEALLTGAVTAGLDVDFGAMIQKNLEAGDLSDAINLVFSAEAMGIEIQGDIMEQVEEAIKPDDGSLLSLDMAVQALVEAFPDVNQEQLMADVQNLYTMEDGTIGNFESVVNTIVEANPDVDREETVAKVQSLLTLEDGTIGRIESLVNAVMTVKPDADRAKVLADVRALLIGPDGTLGTIQGTVKVLAQAATSVIGGVRERAQDKINVRTGLGGLLGGLQSAFTDLRNRDAGGFDMGGIPRLIGVGAQPEAFLPEGPGRFIPNFDKVLAGAGGQGGTHIENVNVFANDEDGGAAAGQAFNEEMRRVGAN